MHTKYKHLGLRTSMFILYLVRVQYHVLYTLLRVPGTMYQRHKVHVACQCTVHRAQAITRDTSLRAITLTSIMDDLRFAFNEVASKRT
jgi:hypothetical protein